MNIQNTLNQPFVPPITIEQDWEDSTLLKVAACIPFIGMFLSVYICDSITNKIDLLKLHKEHQPYLRRDNGDNSSESIKQTAIQRRDYLKSLKIDYLQANIINSLLCLALTICAVVFEIIPVVGGLILGAFYTIAAGGFAISLGLEISTHTVILIEE